MPRPSKHVVEPKERIGDRLRSFRLERGLTQTEVADALGLTQSNVSGIERGVRGLTIQQVIQFAKLLGVATDDILGLKKPASNGVIRDRRLRRVVGEIDALPRRDKDALLKTIHNFLKGSRA